MDQIIRFYGKRTSEVLKNLKMIYVSHMHCDHYLGISSILFELKRLKMENILIVGPPDLDIIFNLHEKKDLANFEFVPTPKLVSVRH